VSTLLDEVIEAHGGQQSWKDARSVEATLAFSGILLDMKGHPGHHRPTVTLDPSTPRATIRNFHADSDDVMRFTPDRVWLEHPDGRVISERNSPQAAFAGHDRSTPWDKLHLAYFLGYALWSYMAGPFVFMRPGFRTRELPVHEEAGLRWRPLEVVYPDGFPRHSKTQTFYFDDDGMLRRIDYTLDLTAGVATHYCLDHKRFDGLATPTLRRIVMRSPEGPRPFGPTLFLLHYADVVVTR
jgi:hypothetical protein